MHIKINYISTKLTLLLLCLQMSQRFCSPTTRITMVRKVLSQMPCGGTATSWTTTRSTSCWCAWCVGTCSTLTAWRRWELTSMKPTQTPWRWTQGSNSEYWKLGMSRCPSGNASSPANSSSTADPWQVRHNAGSLRVVADQCIRLSNRTAQNHNSFLETIRHLRSCITT